MDPEEFAHAIAVVRKRRKWKQKDVAQALSVSEPYLSRLLKVGTNSTRMILALSALYYGVDLMPYPLEEEKTHG